MILRRYLFHVLFLTNSLLYYGCSSSTEPSLASSVGFNQVPTITGIYETTSYCPEGTGKVYGSPSYPQGFKDGLLLRIVPNPSINMIETNNKVYFMHLPCGKITIYIVRGICPVQEIKTELLSSGASVARIGCRPIHTIELNNNLDTGSYSWDGKDDKGENVPTGFYRIYLFYNSTSKYTWSDFYLIQPEDFYSWIDPSGWLEDNWNVIINDILLQ